MKTTNNQSTKLTTEALVIGAVLTALVAILQYFGAFIKLGPFSISLVLVPIVIGAATCGKAIGTWLGFVFGGMVLLTGDAAPFLAIHTSGTIITVLLKGMACGFFAGLVYDLTKKFNHYAAVAASAVICPIVNTGIFLLGCRIFFFDAVSLWAAGENLNVFKYMIVGLVGFNFLIELGINLVLSPVIVRILNIRKIK